MNPIPGVVVSTAPLTVRVDGSSTEVPARRLASYAAAPGDRVAILPMSSELLVLGRIL